jgi:phage-related protein
MPVLNAIGGLFTNLFQSLMPLINILLNIITPVLTVVIKGITILVNLLAKVLIPYIEFLGKVWGKVFGFIPTAVEGVVTAVEWMINKVIGLINKLIDRVNSIGKYVGLTLDRIDDVNIDISAPKWNDVNVNQEVKTTTEATVGSSKEADGFMQTQDVLKNNYATTNIQNNSQNYDYSTKDISINVTVENYAENLDVDDLVTQINMKLAEQM